MQVNAILTATGTGTQAGKKITTTISHLRQSQESKAEQLAQALNQFTTNTYVSTQINEIGIIDFTPNKEIPNLTLGDWETASGLTYGRVATITYNGDGTLGTSTGLIITQDGQKRLNAGSGATGVLYATEGTNYTPAVTTFTAT